MASPHDLSDTPEEPEQEIDNDIYRGDGGPSQTATRPPDVQSVSSSSSSSFSSSSGSFTTGIGALAAVVENAISRWARRNSSGSSSSSSTSSLSSHSHRSSVCTRSRHHSRRKHRPSSVNFQSAASERGITARIRAKQESRQVLREFTLYLPPELSFDSLRLTNSNSDYPTENVHRSTSLPHVLNQLESALKKSSKLCRNKEKARQSATLLSPPSVSVYQDYMLPDSIRAPSRPASFTDLTALRPSRKGKQKESSSGVRTPTSLLSSAPPNARRAPKAWWLDVANPTWDDMRAIGKVCH